MCLPNLFPTGRCGEHEPQDILPLLCEYIKSRWYNKDSRYRKRAEYIFYPMHLKLMREIKAGIYNCLQKMSVRELLHHLENEASGAPNSIGYWDFGPPTLFLTLSCADRISKVSQQTQPKLEYKHFPTMYGGPSICIRAILPQI